VIVHNGRVAGTWSANAGRPDLTFFETGGQPDPGTDAAELLSAEVERLSALLY
jgi:hypothetical protein